MSKIIDESGNRYGRLAVLHRAPNNRFGQTYWTCQCDCGQVVNVFCGNLRAGKSKSCGCRRLEANSLEYQESSINRVIDKYRLHAKNSGRQFALTRDEFIKITSSHCFYCGRPPLTKGQSCKSGKTGTYFYNGIDRVNNDDGYTSDNCVPCCTMCNLSKKDYTKEEFLSWIKRVHDYTIARQISGTHITVGEATHG